MPAPLLLFLALLLRAPSASVGATGEWVTVHEQTPKQKGTKTQPSIRYGHAAVSVGDDMIITHGYYYDRETSSATWLSDSWAMGLDPPHTWRQLNKGMSQEQTYDAYADGKKPYLPAGRFGHMAAVHNGSVYMHGGHDGGISRHGRQNYEPGYDFDEIWKLRVKTGSWKLLDPKPDAGNIAKGGSGSPGKRYLGGSAVVADKYLTYGGLSEKQGDMWALNLVTSTWELLCEEVFSTDGGPGRRVGHSLTPVDFPASTPEGGRTQGVLLYGGRYIDHTGSSLTSDVFFFDLSTQSWRQLALAPGSPEPRARKYHAKASAWIPAPGGASSSLMGFIIGGTITTPGLTCSAETWAFSLDCDITQITWTAMPNIPAALYDSRATTSSKHLFTFGGHLCSDSKGEHPWHYVNEVQRLELKTLTAPPGACQVPAEDVARSVKAAAAIDDGEEL
eukprot:gene17900-24292_t